MASIVRIKAVPVETTREEYERAKAKAKGGPQVGVRTNMPRPRDYIYGYLLDGWFYNDERTHWNTGEGTGAFYKYQLANVKAVLTQRLQSEGIAVENDRVSLADKPRAVAVAREVVVMANARRSKLTILLNENLECLSAALKDSGFKVISIKKGTPDSEVMELAEGTAILTKNSKDFLRKAVRFDFDVISVENVKFIDDLPDSSNSTVTKISDAVRSSGFATQRGNFNLIIMDDGSYRMDALV